MDRQQITLLATMSGAFVLMVLLAAAVGSIASSSGDGLSSSPIPADKPLKKFYAKPGTERENARKSVTSRRDALVDDGRPGSKRNDPIEIRVSLDMGGFPATAPPRDVQLDRATPEEALAIVMASLDETGDEALSHTEQYAGLGYVLARQVPFDAAAAEEAFAKSKRMITGDDDLQLYLYFRCKAWLAAGNYQAIHDELVKHSPEWLRPGARSLEIGIMRAYAEEYLEQEADAEMAYRWVMEATYSWQSLSEPRCEGVYRQAARRLARLYRKQGLEEEAIATSERMHVALDSIRGAA